MDRGTPEQLLLADLLLQYHAKPHYVLENSVTSISQREKHVLLKDPRLNNGRARNRLRIHCLTLQTTGTSAHCLSQRCTTFPH